MKYAFWLGPVGPSDKENQVKMNKKYCLGTLPLWNGRDPDRIKQSDAYPYQMEKQDPDPYKNVWIRNTGWLTCIPHTEVGKVTLKINGDEVLSDESV
jgi:hypothetical protein